MSHVVCHLGSITCKEGGRIRNYSFSFTLNVGKINKINTFLLKYFDFVRISHTLYFHFLMGFRIFRRKVGKIKQIFFGENKHLKVC